MSWPYDVRTEPRYPGPVVGLPGVARALAAFLLAAPLAAQIVTENAGVISPELTIVREVVGLARSENLDELRWTQELLFAPDRTHEFRLSVPWVSSTARFDAPGGELEHDQQGLGDVSLRFKQALWRADEVMRSERVALTFELGAPTGAHDARENGVAVPRALQLGSGAWSFGVGAASTWIQDRRRVALAGSYRHRTRHDGLQPGATAELDAAFWYRLSPAVFQPGESGSEIRGVLELLASHTFASELGGVEQDDDGGIVWLAPGIQFYPTTSVLLEANVQVPLYQDLDDALGERRWSANLVLKLLF